ncbi:hypothetical protein H0I76_00060 [Limibaculum sp. M0105]|uniref:Lipoprotein n=1 Tax=Thermohalobaculum xanthum TaxID=2753746 RepID=A0A8J7M3L4_9RHOB|nr:hypothetical protein [Thermohalobaculum xanthum]MBK0397568.1 hypothetical protein [Thermohalobaculum xanthum]
MRLRRSPLILPALVLAALLGGCSLFGGDDESEAEAAAIAARQPEPMQALRKIEIGRTRDGYAITAYGTAPTTGYGAPSLRPRRDGQPGPDGYIDFDFVAVPPDPALNMPQGTLTAREIRADAQLIASRMRGVTGFRVHTLSNSGQVDF